MLLMAKYQEGIFICLHLIKVIDVESARKFSAYNNIIKLVHNMVSMALVALANESIQ